MQQSPNNDIRDDRCYQIAAALLRAHFLCIDLLILRLDKVQGAQWPRRNYKTQQTQDLQMATIAVEPFGALLRSKSRKSCNSDGALRCCATLSKTPLTIPATTPSSGRCLLKLFSVLCRWLLCLLYLNRPSSGKSSTCLPAVMWVLGSPPFPESRLGG